MRHPRSSLTALAGLCATLLSGCGGPPDQSEILVVTTPPGASCTLTRLGQPIATVAPTPAIALVEPSAGEIAVHCSRQGFADAAATLPARETWLGFGTMYGRPASDYQRRVDLVLVPRPLGQRPGNGAKKRPPRGGRLSLARSSASGDDEIRGKLLAPWSRAQQQRRARRSPRRRTVPISIGTDSPILIGDREQDQHRRHQPAPDRPLVIAEAARRRPHLGREPLGEIGRELAVHARRQTRPARQTRSRSR